MYSSAYKVDGQGVGSAYEEQVNLVKEGASDIFEVGINKSPYGFYFRQFRHIRSTYFAFSQLVPL